MKDRRTTIDKNKWRHKSSHWRLWDVDDSSYGVSVRNSGASTSPDGILSYFLFIQYTSNIKRAIFRSAMNTQLMLWKARRGYLRDARQASCVMYPRPVFSRYEDLPLCHESTRSYLVEGSKQTSAKHMIFVGRSKG